MQKIISKDGTAIAYEQVGRGTPIILVMGAFNDHFTSMPLGKLLETQFTVFHYDRRARGESGNTLPYAVEREIEDLDALITLAGGSAAVFGYSSGGTLALKAAADRLAITKLVIYEDPFFVEDSPSRPPANMAEQLAHLVAEGRKGDAVELFQTKAIGIPAEVVARFKQSPMWVSLEAMAQSIVYDATITGDPALPMKLAPSVNIPTLVMSGGASPKWMQNSAVALATALSAGQSRILEGQTHDIVPEVIAPIMIEFLLNGS